MYLLNIMTLVSSLQYTRNSNICSSISINKPKVYTVIFIIYGQRYIINIRKYLSELDAAK